MARPFRSPSRPRRTQGYRAARCLKHKWILKGAFLAQNTFVVEHTSRRRRHPCASFEASIVTSCNWCADRHAYNRLELPHSMCVFDLNNLTSGGGAVRAAALGGRASAGRHAQRPPPRALNAAGPTTTFTKSRTPFRHLQPFRHRTSSVMQWKHEGKRERAHGSSRENARGGALIVQVHELLTALWAVPLFAGCQPGRGPPVGGPFQRTGHTHMTRKKNSGFLAGCYTSEMVSKKN